MGLVYQPWPWLSLYGNYVESLGAANSGRSMSGQPFEPEKYDFHEAPLSRLSLGAGVFLVGQRECDNANTCELPGYGRVDAFAAYQWTSARPG